MNLARIQMRVTVDGETHQWLAELARANRVSPEIMLGFLAYDAARVEHNEAALLTPNPAHRPMGHIERHGWLILASGAREEMRRRALRSRERLALDDREGAALHLAGAVERRERSKYYLRRAGEVDGKTMEAGR